MLQWYVFYALQRVSPDRYGEKAHKKRGGYSITLSAKLNSLCHFFCDI
jgi:hypothetical protein